MNTPNPLKRAGRALTLALALALACTPAAFAETIRDIYSTRPGTTGFYLASASDNEGGAETVSSSTTTVYSAPNSLRLKFQSGVARNIVGIRFTASGSTPSVINLQPNRLSGALEFWVNPKASPSVPSFSVGLVSNNGTKVETRRPLSNYLAPSDYADKWTFVSIPLHQFSNTGQTSQGASATFDWTKVVGINFSCNTTGTPYYDPSVDDIRIHETVTPLSINGRHFKKSDGSVVRLWGMNLSAVYPTQSQSVNLAGNLSSLGINVVRHHHNMRHSADWISKSTNYALASYDNDTRAPNTTAWDRFHYLNAQLRAEGIYLVHSLHGTRRFKPGDVSILTTTSSDANQWVAAMNALRSMEKNLDLFKILPVIDERCARLMEEFATRLVTHVNPYTGLSYGRDPQVLYFEILNEHSSEYAIVAGNKFQSDAHPAVSYWTTVLQNKWNAYSSANGLPTSNVYSPSTNQLRLARNKFLRELDLAYHNRIKAHIANLGTSKPVVFSNLWRGEDFQAMQESISALVEDHAYPDPHVTRERADVFSLTSRSAPVSKPYILGELNQKSNEEAVAANNRHRTTLQLAAATYGAFNDWSGIIWYAWAHGDRALGNDGWATTEYRTPPSHELSIGDIQTDGMMIDHLRTTGRIFTRGLVSPSTTPRTWYASTPVGALNYEELMAAKNPFQAGWQNINSIRRAFGPVPSSQATASWMTTVPANPLVSDTSQIRKDIQRQHLVVSSPRAEAFSGKLHTTLPAGLGRINMVNTVGYATVILVSDDSQNISSSNRLIISRTYLDTHGAERSNQTTKISGLKTPASGYAWHIRRTRPRGISGTHQAITASSGVYTLPSDNWKEAELIYAPINSLP